MKHLSSARRRILTYFLLVALPACGEPIAPPTPVAAVKVTPENSTLVPGATVTLAAAPVDAQGKPLTRTITWSSSDPSVASVAAGVVTALSPGSANISATAAGTVGSAPIVVKEGGLLLPTGGTISTTNGRASVVVPAGAVASQAQLIVDVASNPLASTRLVSGTAYSFDAGAAALAQPVTITVKYDPGALTAGAAESGLKLYQLSGGKWQRVLTSSVDAAADRVSATVPTLGTYAILEQAPATAAINAGNGQVAEVSSSVATAPSIKVIDSDGFAVPGLSVQFAVATGGGTVTGGSTATNADGIATVGNWKLGNIAGLNTLTATVTGASGGPFTFTATGIPAAASKLVFTTTPPETAQSGQPWSRQPVIQVTDVFGNAVSTAGVAVTASLASGSGTLSGTKTVTTNASGIATFTDLILSGLVGSKTIAFTSGTLTSLNSSITLSGGSARTIAISSGDNQTAIAGSAVATAPSVRVADAEGNPVAGVTVVFAVASGGGSVSGATAVTDALGIARVGSWTLGQTAGTNTLTATAAGLSGSPVTFTAVGGAGAAGRLALVTAPTTNPRSRIVFAEQPSVQLQDASGNAVSQSGIIVTASISSGGGTLSGTLTATTNAQGRATFTDLALSGTVGPRTLNFSTPGITPVSATVTLGAGNPATIISNGGDLQTAKAGSAVFTPPSVVVKDADGNKVQGVTVLFTPASGSGTVTGGSALTDAFGIATVGSWTLGTSVGSNTLSATISGLPSQTLSFTATSTPGDAAEILLIGGNGQSAAAGRGIQDYVTFRVFDAFGNPVPNAQVNFSVTSGNGSLTHSTATTLSTGIAVMAGWTLGPATGTQTVTATVSGLAGKSATVSATAVTVRITTFGDSNTDYGYFGNNPTINAISYVSANPNRQPASTPNNITQLAGKIEAGWAPYSPSIIAVNHGVLGTGTGSARSTAGAPSARTEVNGITRFAGEVLGFGYPWSGAEPVNSSFQFGPISRVKSYTPTVNDFVYVSIGTNDPNFLISPIQTVENITWMIDQWTGRGYPASHFILTNLAPSQTSGPSEAQLNRELRQLAIQKGVGFIDLTNYTSNDDGQTWKSSSLHVGDSVHYAESVRDWIAGEVIAIMVRVTAPIQ